MAGRRRRCEYPARSGDGALVKGTGMARKNGKNNKNMRHHDEVPEPAADAQRAGGAELRPRMKRKRYERHMKVLHGELVALQEWVKSSGAKICVVFEGRDTAGKGGTIKRITERVSPRVF